MCRTFLPLIVAASLTLLGQTSQPASTLLNWERLTPPFDRNLDASVTLGPGSLLVFKGAQYGLYSSSQGTTASGTLKSLPGWPTDWKEVHAAARWTDRTVILFNEGSYVLYDAEKRRFSQPANIADLGHWPSEWTDGVDAAIEGSDNILYLFRGSQYITLDKSNSSVKNGPLEIRDWKGWPSRWIDGIDSGDNPGDGNLYFFRGDEVLAYNLKKRSFVKGYPKRIAAQTTTQVWPPVDPAASEPLKRPVEWNGMPPPFNAGPATAVSFDKDKTLFFKGSDYLLYTHVRDDKGTEKVTAEVGPLAKLDGWPVTWKEVHAAARWNDSTVILFNEEKYLRYNLRDRKLGPEKDLSDLSGWPEDWTDGIDAAVEDDDGDTLYLFRGPTYISLSKSQQAITTDPAPLTEWTGFPTKWLDGIDGADNPGDGRTYFFRDREVLVWDNENARVVTGYPKTLPDAPPLSTQVWPPAGKSTPANTPQPGDKPLLAFSGLAVGGSGGVDAGAPIGGDNLLLFRGERYAIYSTTTDGMYQNGDVKTILGWPKEWKKVDAAATWDDRTLVLFNGGEFIQYNTKTRSFRGEAEPVTAIPNWPPGWTDGIDAAVNLDDDTLYLFRGSAYVTMSKSSGEIKSTPESAKAWEGWPETWIGGPTGAVESTDGRVYFFRNSEYLPYEPLKETFVAGFPKQLPGTSPDMILAAWPPVALPPAATVGAVTGTATANGSITESNGQLQVTSIVPLERGERLSKVNATALNLTTSTGRVIPLAVSDPSHFNLNVSAVTGSTTSTGATTGTGGGGGTATVIKFRDDYPANNTFEWGLPWVSLGADYLGAGYDPLTLNPANYGDVSLRSPFQAVTLTPSFQRNLDGSLNPYCAVASPGNTGQVSTQNTTVTTLQEYQNHFNIDSSVSVGVPKASVTVGGGYSRFNDAKNGRDEIHVLRQATIGLYRMRMDLTCIDNTSGDYYRQKLDLNFRARVKALTDPSKAIQDANALSAWTDDPDAHKDDLKQWRNNLAPPLRAQYSQLLSDYGYWIATSVTLGGQFRSKLTISKDLYQRSNKTETRFNTDVEATIKGVTLGASLKLDKGNFTNAEKGKEDMLAENETSGGKPSTEFDIWAPTVSDAPVPVKAQFRPLADLASADFFPEDPQIASKSLILRVLMAAHMAVDAPDILSAANRDEFFKSAPRKFRVSLEKALPTISRRFIPKLKFSLLGPNFAPVLFMDSPNRVTTEYDFTFDDDLRIAAEVTQPIVGKSIDIYAPDDPTLISTFADNKLRFWGELSSYGYDDPGHAFGGAWPNRSQKVTRFELEDIDLSELGMQPGTSTKQVDVTFADGGETITFTFKVERIQ